MLILSLLGIIICIRTVSQYDLGPGVKIPKAKELDELLFKFMNYSHLSHGSASDFLLGINANESDSSADLDVTVLDMPTLKKIIHAAQKKLLETSARRYDDESEILLNPNKGIEKKCFDLMKGSIYSARYRIQDTNRFRERYSSDPSYNIGVFISTINQLLIKMESLYTAMHNLKWQTHFVWYLIIYEKMLACNIDINFSVERVFVLHDRFAYAMNMAGGSSEMTPPTGMALPPGMG